jgi:AcrR family transcriptional regulator
VPETRNTAARRRAQAVEFGVAAFADHGCSTVAVARVAAQMGVSQPYVFRLFGSKEAFFLACIDAVEALVLRSFDRAAAGGHGSPMEDMGAAFRELVADGSVGGMWLQACAMARNDESIARRCRELLSTVLRAAQRHTGAASEQLAAFMGRGALVVLLQSLGVDLGEGSAAAVEGLRTAVPR